ncbi:MAG: hypothetical protein V4773_13650 [Verrucomicrobiota bacterium]
MYLSKPAVLGAALASSFILFGCKKAEPAAGGSAASSAAAPATPTAATKAEPAKAASNATVPEGVKKLLGRWVRTDGGYALELRNPDISGKLEAGYYNPKSINVSRSIWMQGGPGLQVAVELNDTGYPGATYVLNYDAQGDRLVGQYTQPQMQQTFEVEFLRQNAPPLK